MVERLLLERDVSSIFISFRYSTGFHESLSNHIEERRNQIAIFQIRAVIFFVSISLIRVVLDSSVSRNIFIYEDSHLKIYLLLNPSLLQLSTLKNFQTNETLCFRDTPLTLIQRLEPHLWTQYEYQEGEVKQLVMTGTPLFYTK